MSDRAKRQLKSAWNRAVAEVDALDRAVYDVVAETPTPALDGPIARLSNAANFSALWLVIAAGMALVGGAPGRRAAVRGLCAVGITSAVANLGMKKIFRRARPSRSVRGEDDAVQMPGSTSFPSGHSASAFAFTLAAAREVPALALPLVPLAAAVGYSRIHTGVHYPGDVLAGALLGSVIGTAFPRVLVVGTGIDPVTSRFSGARSTN